MKALRIFLGSLTGAFITALCFAILCWSFTYTDPSSGFLGPARSWAPLAAIAGGSIGLIVGLLLGAFLTWRKFGLGLGALYGVFAGFIVILLLVLNSRIPPWPSRDALLLISLL